MKYENLPLAYEEQADQLMDRGMGGGGALIVSRLKAVSYCRLSGYWFPFREPDPSNPPQRLDGFRPATTFEDVWNRCVFGRRLRLIALDAIERNKVTDRSQPIFGIITVRKWSLDRIAPQSRWAGRLEALLAKFPRFPPETWALPTTGRNAPCGKGPGVAPGGYRNIGKGTDYSCRCLTRRVAQLRPQCGDRALSMRKS